MGYDYSTPMISFENWDYQILVIKNINFFFWFVTYLFMKVTSVDFETYKRIKKSIKNIKSKRTFFIKQ